ncbi:MAG: ROK family protein [Herpetosiphon sp.]
MRQFIGVDLGGTQVRAARVDDAGVIHCHRAVATSNQGPAVVIDQIERVVNEVRGDVPWQTIEGVGVGSPGPVDGRSGIVFQAPNLPAWFDVPLKQILRERLPVHVEVGNDANSACLGEWLFGSGKGTTDFVYVTISTGIGGGAIADGKLLLGRGGLAVEVGHMTIAMGQAPCGCGNNGCWEALASGTALARRAAQALSQTPTSLLNRLATPSNITAEAVGQGAAMGDPLALSLMNDEGVLLGVGIVNLLHLYSPSRVTLGGGLINSASFFWHSMIETIDRLAMNPYKKVPIALATLGPNVGVLGAAALVQVGERLVPQPTVK